MAFGVSGFIWESLTALIPLQQRQSNLCMFLQHGKGKFVNFVLTLSQTKISGVITPSDGQKKNKACFNRVNTWKREFQWRFVNKYFVPWLGWQEWNHCSETSQSEGNNIKLQIVKEGHCREKRRSKRLSIKQHGHACIRSWYQRAKEPHGNPSDMLWLISSDHHAYSQKLVASRASFMILLLQSTPCWNFNRKSHFSALNYLWVNTLSPTDLKSSYSDWSKCGDPFLGH